MATTFAGTNGAILATLRRFHQWDPGAYKVELWQTKTKFQATTGTRTRSTSGCARSGPDDQSSSTEPKGKFDEDESEAVGDTHAGVLDDDNDSTGEEAAVHLADDAPGAVDSDTDSYTGDKV